MPPQVTSRASVQFWRGLLLGVAIFEVLKSTCCMWARSRAKAAPHESSAAWTESRWSTPQLDTQAPLRIAHIALGPDPTLASSVAGARSVRHFRSQGRRIGGRQGRDIR
jgi:hypothetical protein